MRLVTRSRPLRFSSPVVASADAPSRLARLVDSSDDAPNAHDEGRDRFLVWLTTIAFVGSTLITLVALGAALAGCEPGTCVRHSDCASGLVCSAGQCISPIDADLDVDAATTSSRDAASIDGGATASTDSGVISPDVR